MLPWIILTALGVAVLLAGEQRRSPLAKGLAKPLASAGFIGTAIAAGALASDYGRAILVALALSWLGDIFLLSSRPRPFLAGLVAFLLAHVAYVAAFVVRGQEVVWSAPALMLLALPAVGIFRWLRPHLPEPMRLPVLAYIGAISAMLATGVGALAAGGPASALIGALAFYLSDLAVARDRFVAAGFANRAWGLPLYYFGQLCLASSVQV